MSQFQHYVPQFILRNYSDYVKPKYEDYVDKQRYRKDLKKVQKGAAVHVLNFKDGFANGQLNRSPCRKIFGLLDMYNDEIEKSLSWLEGRVSRIIAAIEKDFSNGRADTLIARPEKDLLRKFIFIMAYRNRNFHERFGGDEDNYDSNDRTELIAYMHDKGLKSPKDVWLKNIRAFIDVDLGQEVEGWYEWLRNNAYPGDAKWFWKNMTTSFLCFCTPEDADEEFVLTQNAYGVFEGPSSHLGWTDWHTFAPVNHKLVIVMRNQFLSGSLNLPSQLEDFFTLARRTAVQSVTSVYEDPAAAHSWLEDLPVSRPATSYPNLLVSSGSNKFSHKFTPEDTFTFSFFRLPSTFVQRINSIFIEEAITTDMIVHKSSPAFRRALESYLGIEKPGFKVAAIKPQGERSHVWRADHNGVKETGEAPEYERQAYLGMLARITRSLGSDCVAKFTLSLVDHSPVVVDEQCSPHREQTNSNEYAARTSEAGVRSAPTASMVAPPPNATITLSLSTGTRDTFLAALVAENNAGPEDVVVDCISVFSPHRVSRAMMRASGMRQYSELCPSQSPSTSTDKYFMAAMAYVGSITDCDLPTVKEAAIRSSMEADPMAIKAVSAKLNCSESIAHEMWTRYWVHHDFEHILGNAGLQDGTIQLLKKFLFQLLYPLQ